MQQTPSDNPLPKKTSKSFYCIVQYYLHNNYCIVLVLYCIVLVIVKIGSACNVAD
jgi:hypothetical protein